MTSSARFRDGFVALLGVDFFEQFEVMGIFGTFGFFCKASELNRPSRYFEALSFLAMGFPMKLTISEAF